MYLYEQKFADHSEAVKASMLKVEVLPKKLDEEVAPPWSPVSAAC
jgi:adenosylhomocysteinase